MIYLLRAVGSLSTPSPKESFIHFYNSQPPLQRSKLLVPDLLRAGRPPACPPDMWEDIIMDNFVHPH